MNKNKVSLIGFYGSDELIAIKTKIPNQEWLDYIKNNLYYKDGNVYSKNSEYNKPLGSLNSSKYLCTVLEPKRLIPRKTLNVKVHHLVWFLNTKKWSEVELDHKDQNKTNNIFENLRQSNRIEQVKNRNNLPKREYNLRYIHYWKTYNIFRIVKNKKVLGKTNTLEEAIKLRNNLNL